MIKSFMVTSHFKSKCLDPLVITFWFISNHIFIGKLVLVILAIDLQKFFSFLPLMIILYFQYKVAKEIFRSSEQFCTPNIFSISIIYFSTNNEIWFIMLLLRHSDSISPINPFIPLNLSRPSKYPWFLKFSSQTNPGSKLTFEDTEKHSIKFTSIKPVHFKIIYHITR